MDSIGSTAVGSYIDIINGNVSRPIPLDILESEAHTFDHIHRFESGRDGDGQGLECTVRQSVGLTDIVLIIMGILLGIVIFQNQGRRLPLRHHAMIDFEPNLQNITILGNKAKGKI